MGVGAFAAGIFHLYTHAFFKALMFLGSGAVIHALHGEQDMRRMGGLKRDLPITYWTFLVGTLAISGVPLLSGFFSKDEILFLTFTSGHRALWLIGVVTALLTATYMFRLLFMTFHGEPRYAVAAAGSHDHDRARARRPRPCRGMDTASHGQAAGRTFTTRRRRWPSRWSCSRLAPSSPATSACRTRWAARTRSMASSSRASIRRSCTVRPSPAVTPRPARRRRPRRPGEAAGGHAAEETHASASTEYALMAISIVAAFAGIGIATYFFLRNPAAAAAMAARFPGLHRLLLNKYYVDELYDAAIVQPIKRVSETLLWKQVDSGLIDGAVNGAGSVVRGSATLLRLAQTGSVRAYAASLFVGVLIILGYYLVR